MDADLPAWLFEVGSRLFRMLSCTQTCTYPVAVKGKALEGKWMRGLEPQEVFKWLCRCVCGGERWQGLNNHKVLKWIYTKSSTRYNHKGKESDREVESQKVKCVWLGYKLGRYKKQPTATKSVGETGRQLHWWLRPGRFMSRLRCASLKDFYKAEDTSSAIWTYAYAKNIPRSNSFYLSIPTIEVPAIFTISTYQS